MTSLILVLLLWAAADASTQLDWPDQTDVDVILAEVSPSSGGETAAEGDTALGLVAGPEDLGSVAGLEDLGSVAGPEDLGPETEDPQDALWDEASEGHERVARSLDFSGKKGKGGGGGGGGYGSGGGGGGGKGKRKGKGFSLKKGKGKGKGLTFRKGRKGSKGGKGKGGGGKGKGGRGGGKGRGGGGGGGGGYGRGRREVRQDDFVEFTTHHDGKESNTQHQPDYSQGSYA